MKVRAHVFVSGRVQGVFFRAETRNIAHTNHVVGWVRNLSDGRVEALFEGEKQNVEKAVEFCKRGPSGAYIRNVDVIWENWKGEFNDFRIWH